MRNMGGRYQININPKLTIELKKVKERKIFIINGSIHFEIDDYEKLIEILEDLSSIEDLKEKQRKLNLNEYVSFNRNYISDLSIDYNYSFRITETEKNRHSSHSIEIKGINQLKLLKNALFKIYEKFKEDEWLNERIRSEGLKYVEFDGKKIEVEKRYGRLNLNNLGIKKITDIKGLNEIQYLKMLFLMDNEIEEIKGLDHLIHLRFLSIGKNYIKEIKGLDKLVNLEELSLYNNPIKSLSGLEQFENLTRLDLTGTLIPKELFQEAGITDPAAAQDLIKYLNTKKANEEIYEETKMKTIEYIKKAAQVFEEISFSKIISKTGIKLQDLEEMVEDLIFSEKINAKIRKDGIAFIEENPLIDIALETVDVLYGIKDDTQLISKYTSYIEDVFDKTENIEEYLKSHLAGEFEKIRNSWQDYKEGKIEKREFIKIGIREIGKKFVKIFLKNI